MRCRRRPARRASRGEPGRAALPPAPIETSALPVQRTRQLPLERGQTSWPATPANSGSSPTSLVLAQPPGESNRRPPRVDRWPTAAFRVQVDAAPLVDAGAALRAEPFAEHAHHVKAVATEVRGSIARAARWRA